MKVAPLHKAFNKYKDEIRHLICHTGQHYDEKMSKVFFDDLELPKPDFYLGVGSGTHAEQTARIMVEFEKILKTEQPDMIVVVGDVNSTIACSLVAAKLRIRIAHVEAGLRSFDRTMPEEINRLLTDAISDLLFVTEKSGLENLKREGISEERVFYVGNVMIDSLVHYLPKTERSNILKELGLEKLNFIVVTLHRPRNVDSKDELEGIIKLLNSLSKEKTIVFPIHPRTRTNLIKFGLHKLLLTNVLLSDPIGYIDFLTLIKNAALVITDSGGIQEESTYLGVQCVTLRDNTERPITVEVGTNQLIGTDFDKAEMVAREVLHGRSKKNGGIPHLWDGMTSTRIVDIIHHKLSLH